MFQEKRLAFMYALSPVHMGSGTSLGVIDNPIQREKHTGHPVFAGSGIKGACREAAKQSGCSNVNIIFGPDTNASEHAGAASFTDAQIVAFPVRSLRHGFVYATSPIALSRMIRLARAVGISPPVEMPSEPNDESAIIISDELLSEGKLILESYEFKKQDGGENLKNIANWLADQIFDKNSGYSFFKEKLKKHLVLISDTQFSYFVNNSTLVEPHVRIDDNTGTSDDGGLFFTENVPPESIFVSLVMASQERKKKGDGGKSISASEIMAELEEILSGKLLQIGGDATTGRGQVFIRFNNKEE